MRLSRLRPTRRAEILEGASVLALSASFCLGVAARINRTVSIYLPPDAGNYLASAHGLVAPAVSRFSYAPGAPALLLICQRCIGDLSGFKVAMLISLGLVLAAHFVLLRCWHPPVEALVGTFAVAAAAPWAEAVGWGGLATVLGMSFAVFAVAFAHRWRADRASASLLATGMTLVLAATTHVLAFLAALIGVLCVTVRGRRPHPPRGWTSCRQVCAALACIAAVLALARSYYSSLTPATVARPGVPDLGTVVAFARFAAREHVGLLALPVAALASPWLGEHASERRVALGFVAVIVLLVACIQADAAYRYRALYLLPTLYGIAFANIARLLARRLSTSAMTVLSCGSALFAVLLAASFLPRLDAALPYYSLVTSDDLAALHDLRGGTGLVVTSWNGTDYGSGNGLAWLVNGIGYRRAVGPTYPYLLLGRGQADEALPAQQLLAGELGIQNHVAQVAVGPPGSRRSPLLSVEQDGFYEPLLYEDVTADRPGLSGTTLGMLPSMTLAASYSAPNGDEVEQRIQLDGKDVTVRLFRSDTAEAFVLWLWPPAGVVLEGAQNQRSAAAAFDAVSPRLRQHLTVSALGGETVQFHQAELRFGLPAVAVTVPSGAESGGYRISVARDVSTGPLTSFTERDLLRRLDVTEILVTRSSGVAPRLQAPCYFVRRRTSALLLYGVRLSCRAP